MADIFLRRYYERLGPLVAVANEVRVARSAKDAPRAKMASERFLGVSDIFRDEINAYSEYRHLEEEWVFAHGVWRHGIVQAQQPAVPAWPNLIPKFREALDAINWLMFVRKRCQETIEEVNRRGTIEFDGEDFFCLPFNQFINNLDVLRELLQEPADGQPDGMIDRNQLATLLNLSPKTLANRASELPAPIARDSRSVPIYRYLSAKHAAAKAFPDRAGALPSTYQEAIKKLSDT